MSSIPKTQLEIVKSGSNDPQKPADLFKTRESKELVIAFSGPVGSAVDLVASETKKILESFGYAVEMIKLSAVLQALGKAGKIEGFDESKLEPALRYEHLQNMGDELRKTKKNDILAELSISKIAVSRTKHVPSGTEVADHVPTKTAYLIDQLKHPDEVQLLRTVYGNLFFLIGVFCGEAQRKRNLTAGKRIDEESAVKIMERDRKNNDEHGQQLEKTLKLADFFLRNSLSQTTKIADQLNRFFGLVHGQNGISPTNHEYAMYAAFSAGLRSACLSRQVGAAIVDSGGNLLSTGCNDVPKSGGGLYTERDGHADFRCVKMEGGKCFNDDQKNVIRDRIEQILGSELQDAEKEKIKDLADKIKKDSGLKDLIEFSRSVHAEMDAIVSLARKGGTATNGASLYTTTYPCHNCARHIVAAGISNVYYIEPYEKSLARELHHDSIAHDEGDTRGEESKKISFLHFEGVSPRQYQNFFYPKSDRKNSSGRAVFSNASSANKSHVQLLDDYRTLESKVVAYLKDEIGFDGNLFT